MNTNKPNINDDILISDNKQFFYDEKYEDKIKFYIYYNNEYYEVYQAKNLSETNKHEEDKKIEYEENILYDKDLNKLKSKIEAEKRKKLEGKFEYIKEDDWKNNFIKLINKIDWDNYKIEIKEIDQFTEKANLPMLNTIKLRIKKNYVIKKDDSEVIQVCFADEWCISIDNLLKSFWLLNRWILYDNGKKIKILRAKDFTNIVKPTIKLFEKYFEKNTYKIYDILDHLNKFEKIKLEQLEIKVKEGKQEKVKQQENIEQQKAAQEEKVVLDGITNQILQISELKKLETKLNALYQNLLIKHEVKLNNLAKIFNFFIGPHATKEIKQSRQKKFENLLDILPLDNMEKLGEILYNGYNDKSTTVFQAFYKGVTKENWAINS